MLNQRFRSYSIRTLDKNNYVIVKHGKNEKSGADTESILGYYSQIIACVKEIARLEANEKKSLAEWLTEYKAVIKEVEEII